MPAPIDAERSLVVQTDGLPLVVPCPLALRCWLRFMGCLPVAAALLFPGAPALVCPGELFGLRCISRAERWVFIVVHLDFHAADIGTEP